MSEKVAIIGISGVYPDAPSLHEFYLNLCDGRDSVREVSAERKALLGIDQSQSCKLIASIDSIERFDHRFFNMSLKEAECIDPQQRFLLQLAAAAIENAGYSLKQFRGSRTGVLLSSSICDYQTLFADSDPMFVMGSLPAALAGRISYLLDLHGPALVMDTACSSSLVAIHEACKKILSGEIDYALSGGINFFYLDDTTGTDDVGILSPDGKSKTFDESANGTGWGEGGGLVLLKKLSRAVADRDYIHAVIEGGAINQDGGRSIGITAPSPQAQTEAIVAAWKDAGIDPRTISFIEAHGTGTKIGDPIEIQGVSDAFKQFTDKTKFCAVSSVKTNLGHLVRAAGIAGVTKSVLALQHRKLFPSVHFKKPNPLIDFSSSAVFVNRELCDWETDELSPVRRCGVSSFGLSGTNAHLVLKEAPPAETHDQDTAGEDVLVTLSAKSPTALSNYVRNLAEYLKEGNRRLADVAYTLNLGRDDYAYRYACVVGNQQQLIENLEGVLQRNENSDWYHTAQAAPSMVFLFSSHATAVDRNLVDYLAERFPVFKQIRNQCHQFTSPDAPSPQVDTFVFQYAVYHLWQSLGLTSQKIIGTGIGNKVVEVITGKARLPEALQAASHQEFRTPFNQHEFRKVFAGILQTESPVFLEMGREGLLSTAAQDFRAELGEFVMLPSFNNGVRSGLLPALCQLYLSGAAINWEQFYEGQIRYRVEVPTYPFEPTRCWHSAVVEQRVTTQTPISSPEQAADNQFGVLTDEDASETEKKVAAIWGEVLKIDRLSCDDDYFNLGGDSLNGTQLINKLAKELNANIEFEDIYTYPTVRSLAEYLDSLSSVATTETEDRWKMMPLTPIVREQEPALSSCQLRMWFIDQIESKSPVYIIPIALRIKGPLNVEVLQQCLNEVVRRHESLRTNFLASDGRPYQLIHPPVTPAVPIIDLQRFPVEERESEALALVSAEAKKRFNLEKDLLLRTTVLRLDEQEHILLFSMHHIISDGWSLTIVVDEFVTLYNAFHAGRPSPLPELPIQYADFAYWQNQWLSGSDLVGQIDYWKQQLSGRVPVLELPTDRTRPAVQNFFGTNYDLQLPLDLSKGIKDLCQREEVTLFMFILAAIQVLLSRYTGEQDIIVGASISGRNRIEVEKLIGFFINTLAMRTDCSGRPSFKELLKRARKVALEAYSHQDVPFDRVVEEVKPERSLSHTPLFQVLLVSENFSVRPLDVVDLEVSVVEPHKAAAGFDLTFFMREDEQVGLNIKLEYNLDLFDESTIKRIAGHLQSLLEAIVADPNQSITDLTLLTGTERHQLFEWNNTAHDYPSQLCIHDLFAAQAARSPLAPAVFYEDQSITYAELNAQANQLAHHLQALGVGPEVTVAILLERSIEMVVSLLAVLKAGGAYLPLDPQNPPERLSLILEDACASVLIGQEHLLASLPAHSAKVVCLEADSRLISEQPADNPQCLATSDNLCYVIYTSGSTGKPKGVLITHRALMNYCSAIPKRLPQPPTSLATVSTFAADLGHTAIYTALCTGAALHVISQQRMMDPAALASYFDQHPVECLKIVPSHLRALFDAEGRRVLPKGVVVVGGEATQWEWAQQWKETGCRVVNHYGPTECTVGVLTGEVGQEVKTASREGMVPLGRPLWNTQIYVLDEQQELLPVGVVGEIYVGGEGLARGYMRQPAQTAERFIPHPYSVVGGQRLYRTGDLGRYRQDGNLEYVGRVDQQVKIRGYRIELGEIEAVLRQHEGVSESVITVQEDGQEKRLVAYVVSRGEQVSSTSELRNYLRERLPEYMIPASFIFLTQLPLTPNGKLDRKALPAADGAHPAMDQLFLSPSTPTEEVLALIWEKVLGIKQAGINDNFFELGGHSLLATQAVSRIREAFSQEVPVRQLFETPTLGALAASIDEKLRSVSGLSGPPLVARGRAVGQAQPLSFAQQRLWFINQLEPDNTAYNISTEVTLKGELDVSALEQTINEVVRRHESLRTRFVSLDGQPMQLVSPAEKVSLPVLDLAGLSEGERKSRRETLAIDEAERSFDLAREQLWRAHLLRLSVDEHVLLFVMHHIISDGWSFSLLTNEIATLYGAFSAGEPSPLADLKLQYPDFAIWQRELLQGEVLEEQLTYWKQQLAGAPEILELPLDRPRPPVQKYKGATQSFALSNTLSEELKEVSRREGASLFMTLLAAFQALLYRYSGQTDIVVGIPIANRNRGETEGLIGFFVNGLAIRAEVSGNQSFRALLDQVRRVSLEAYTHQDLPFEKVVEELRPERSLSYNPLFQVVFALRNVPPQSLQLPGLTISAREIETETTKFDLRLKFDDTTEALTGSWQYNTDLFDAATIRRMQGYFQTLLGSIVLNPNQHISELSMLSADERQQLLAESSSGQQQPQDQCIHQLFEAQVAAAPDAIALTFEDVQLSYGELNRRANQLACYLRSLGVGPEVLVGICVERSPELVVGVLGTIKAGGAYVPLDPAYPAERLALILEDAQVSLLLTQQSLLQSLPLSGAKPICLDSDWEAISKYDSNNPVNLNTADNLIYVIYTSGSTGRPKGVLVSHANVTRLFSSTQPWFQFNRNDVWTMFHSYAFDFSVWELWGALIRGGRLVVVPYLISRSPESFYGLLSKEGVTVLNQTPSAFRQLMAAEENAGGDQELALRLVIFGGEALDLQNLRPWFDRHGDRRPQLVNMYGITETTVHVTYRPLVAHDLNNGHGSVIGGPISDLQVYLLDQQMEPVPIGISGELYVGGKGVARGYLNHPELSAARFVPDPFSGERGGLLYRSGDVARRLSNGEVEYLGRIDHQVKIHGYRIELGEIESALNQHDAVRELVVVAREDVRDDKRLVCYLVPEQGMEPTVDELREFLRQWLPDYMIPTTFVFMDALPLTPNGKLDRRALPAPGHERPVLEESYIAPTTKLESVLAAMWSEILGLERVGVLDNFFDLGGDSIKGAIFINRLQETLGEIVHVVVIFNAPTIKQLVSYLEENYREAAARISGTESLYEGTTAITQAASVNESMVAQARQLIKPLPPLASGDQTSTKNPPAIFILSPPRSGTTLLRVMLAGHPQLFAPPELELLSFNTLRERKAAFSGADSYWLEGTLRALMEIKGYDPVQAKAEMEEYERRDLTTQQFYRQMQEWLGERLLVDKTPSYALEGSILQRAEDNFENAFYIHLLRHPHGMVQSFEEAKLDQIFFRHEHPFTRRELAELIWVISNQNILEFLERVPAERQHQVRFEELISQPQNVLERLCESLGLELHPDMLKPYQKKARRMTDGIHAESRMLGDVKFLSYQGIDSSVGTKWQEHRGERSLGEITWKIAGSLGYERDEVGAGGSGLVPIPSMTSVEGRPLPLSHAQQRLWFLDQLEPNTSSYNIPISIRLRGELNTAVLERSYNEVVRRHASLRTIFKASKGTPFQHITEPQPQTIPVLDLSGLPETEQDNELLQLATEEAYKPFDLSTGPLIRVTLVRLGAADHGLLLTMHHIISDGWSMNVLIQEISALYHTFAAGEPSPLPELKIQYADFAIWQKEYLKGEVLEGHLDYWRGQLAGAPPVLELPTDKPRPAMHTQPGARLPLHFSSTLSTALEQVGQREGVTLFMILLAGWQALLSRYTRQTDVVVGSPIANRQRAEIEALIGFFVNTLVLRTDLSGRPTGRELLHRVREVCLGAYAHQDVPFEILVEELGVERAINHTPLFQVMMVFQNAPSEVMEWPGISVSGVEVEHQIAKFNLTLVVEDRAGEIRGILEYNTDLFEPETIDRMAEHYQRLLNGLTNNVEQRISELPLLSEAEQQQVLVAWNETRTEYVERDCLHRIFETQVTHTPEAIAVLSEDQQWTYAELNRRANQLAWYLQELGVGPEERVAICVERSFEMVIGLLAILKAGGAYVPFDSKNPRERLSLILEDVGATVLLTQQSIIESLPEHKAQTVLLDTEWESISAMSEENPVSSVKGSNLVYVIYTSGSAGDPKGVEVLHHAVVNYSLSMIEVLSLHESRRILNFATISFDAAAVQIYPALLSGATVVLHRDPSALSNDELLHYCERQDLNVLDLPAAFWQQWISDLGTRNIPLPASVDLFMTGGESLSPERLQTWAQLSNPNARFLSSYGPTEATIAALIYQTTSDSARAQKNLHLGQRIPNTEVYLLDHHLQPVPVGVTGEIHIGGAGVARGYVKSPELTAERFVPHQFSDEPGARLYKTGDLARYRSDGSIEFIGREDHQVKVRGFRVETGEIEAALSQHPAIQDVAVLVRRDGAGSNRIAAYVVFTTEQTVSFNALRTYLKDKLPEYMIPTAFVVMESLPITAAGKLDRKALPAPDRSRSELSEDFVAPRTSIEEMLAAIWADMLEIDRVGVYDNFFELGGHSLLATQLISRLRDVFNVELPLRSVFETTTLAGLAEVIQAARQEVSDLEIPPLQSVPRDQSLPLSFAQQRLWFLDQMLPDSAVYNLPSAVRLSGSLDVKALEQSVSEVVRRHETLRTTFMNVGGLPVQSISPAEPVLLPVLDLTMLPAEARDAETRRLVIEEVQRSFDLEREPSWRGQLIRLSEEEHVLLFTMHHIISDGWSMGVLIREVSALYEAYSAGRESSLTELPIQYADFAVWQRKYLQGAVLEGQLKYWREQLAGAPPVLQVPTDHPRPAIQSYHGTRLPLQFSPELTAGLKELSQREGVTLFMTLLAVWQVLLWRYTGQKDVVVGTPIANRQRSEIEGLIGFFVNSLVLRTQLEVKESGRELLRRVREVCLGGYAHQDVPFEMLVEELRPEREMSHTPLFQVMVVLQNAPVEVMQWPGISVSGVAVERLISRFDLTLGFGESEQGIVGSVEYNTDLFERETIERMVGHYERLASALVADVEQSVSEWPLLSEAEQEQLLVEWNNTASAYPRESCIHELFAEQAKRTPQAVALCYEEQSISYGELDERANQLAHYLLSLGLTAEARVGVLLQRSPELVIAILGVLKAGMTYLPLDAAYPAERLRFMVEDGEVPVLLSEEQLLETMPVLLGPVLTLVGFWPELAHYSTSDPELRVDPEQLAYVMYTSGSTGQPKGVAVPHRAVVRLVRDTNYAELSAEHTFLQLAPICFDASTFEIWGPLLNGAKLAIMPPQTPTLEELGEALSKYQVSTLWLTAGLFQMLVEEHVEYLQPVRQLLAGGDVLSVEHVQKVLRALPECRVINGYGPTETTTFACCYGVAGGEEITAGVPIGRPIANTEVYVLDEELRAVAVGVVGELYIGGDGLARGYQGRAELTAERFIPHPYTQRGGERLYRTGDLVRWRADGRLEFQGRRDEQVKVRGYRIELGEIEAVLDQYPGVSEAVVMARAAEDGSKQLVAYVVRDQASGGAVSLGELREYLKEQLPEYMVPGVYLWLEQLPLTANGKVDRRALPEPDGSRPELEKEYVAPGNAVEEVLAGIWSEVLGVAQVGVEDNFFELGGHSLLATQVVSRVREAFRVELPLSELFERATVGALAAVIEAGLRGGSELADEPIRPVSRSESLPLSFAQQRLWFLDQLEPETATYNIPIGIRLSGKLDVEALEQSISEVVRRHETLRTRFVSTDGAAQQVIEAAEPVKLLVTELGGLEAAEQAEETNRLANEEARQPFDLEHGPLWRGQLLRLSAEEHVLLFTMHHIISDGWSMGVLIREVSALYEAFATGQESPLAELPIQYADFAVWQREWLQGAVLEKQLQYWREQLAGAPPVLQLPTDHPRPAIQSYHGAQVELQFSAELIAGLKQLSQREGVTLFMTLLAVWQVLLWRYTGQKDVVVGTPIANRQRSEIEGLIGFFVNSLVLRTQLESKESGRELLRRVREVCLGGYAHQDVPFEMLVEELRPARDMSHTPLFQVMLILQNAPVEVMHWPGISVSGVAVEHRTARFELNVGLGESEQGIVGTVEYNTDLFERETVERLMGHFERLASALVADVEQPVSEWLLLSEVEQEQLVEWNNTQTDYGQHRCLHEMFEAQVERSPEAVAVVYEGQQLTYSELNRRANQLGHYLQGQGVGAEVLVGILMERSLELVVGLLGVLKAGGAYVPLDPGYPAERLRTMVADAAIAVVLTHERVVEVLAEPGVPVVCFESDWEQIEKESEVNPESTVVAENLAYVIHTSGSTGTPKGAMNTHRGIGNRLRWMQQRYQLSVADRVLQKTPLSFDVSVWEFFWPLLEGARLVVARPGGHQDPAYLLELIEQEQITTLHFVPSMLQQFLAQSGVTRQCQSVRQVMCSGEALSLELQERYFEVLRAPLHNLYGPTEAAVDVTSWECQRDERGTSVPIGEPIANVEVYVLDEQMRLAPVGVVGQLYLGGECVGRGYVRQAGLTAERFIPHPYSRVGGERLYRTGDEGRYRADGNLEYVGRADQQVKLRGYRIELGEIEAVLSQHEAVKEVVVMVQAEAGEQKRLMAYVVSAGEASPTTSELRQFMQQRLPMYMLPSVFVFLEALPLNANGKLDRKALPTVDGSRPTLDKEFVSPRTPSEEVMAQIWAQVLGVEKVGVHDNFFELGGDSIISIQIVARARQQGLAVSARQLFQYQTIAELASIATLPQGTDAAQGDLSGSLALTPIQHWFFEKELVESQHFNQAVLLKLQRPINAALLRQLVGALLRHHDGLRLRFTHSEEGWSQEIARFDAEEAVPLTELDYSSVSDEELKAEIEAEATRVQGSLDLSAGPLLRVVLFELGAGRGARLLLVIHHLAVDGVSWRILLEDLQRGYEQLARSERVEFGAKTSSYQQWAESLQEYGESAALQEQMSYWERVWQEPLWRVPSLADGGNQVKQMRVVRQVLSAEETRALLQEVPGVYHTQIQEVLLTALAETLSRWSGVRRVVVEVEGHGREELHRAVDVTRTVGWFTTIYPVVLETAAGASTGERLKQIKEQVRAVPESGIGYGVLRYLKRTLDGGAEGEISFNYLGQLDQVLAEDGLLAGATESAGETRSREGKRHYKVEVGASVAGGQLQVSWSYSREQVAAAEMGRVSEWYIEELREIIRHCAEPAAGGYTPSDVVDFDWTQQDLDEILTHISGSIK